MPVKNRTLKSSVVALVPAPTAPITPRVFRIPDAARYLSATTWFVEELLRSGRITSFIQGKSRVVDRLELDKYIDRRNADAPMTLQHRTANFKKEAA